MLIGLATGQDEQIEDLNMNEQGLASLIFGAMAFIVVAGLLAGYFLGSILLRTFGWIGTRYAIVKIGLVALGGVAGVMGVVATFYESSWDPPPQITFVVSPGFKGNWVILLEDPASSQQLVWQGLDLPFSGKSTTLNATSNGILRFQDLGYLRGRVDIKVEWSDGVPSVGQAGGPAPQSTGAILFSAFNRVAKNEPALADPPFGQSEALAAYILAREVP